MKAVWKIVVVILLAWVAAGRAELSPEDLIRSVDKMSPEQVQEFRQTLEAKLWKPVPAGFFQRMAVDFGTSSSSFDAFDLDSLSLSGGDMEVERVGGVDLGLLWRVCNDRTRVGLRFGSWNATGSNLGRNGYSRVDVLGGSVSLAANYQWIRSESWLLWSEIAPGGSSVALESVDTPSGHATTLRFFDGSYAQLEVWTGGAWRINPVLSLFFSVGYRFAESIKLAEGGRTRDLTIDASGASSRLGLGINF